MASSEWTPALDVVMARINSALDRRDPREFVLACQYRSHVVRQMAAATAEAAEVYPDAVR